MSFHMAHQPALSQEKDLFGPERYTSPLYNPTTSEYILVRAAKENKKKTASEPKKKGHAHYVQADTKDLGFRISCL